MQTCDVLIIGAGAAGMMCAIEAGRRGRSVLLLDHAKTAGEKIRISGGGRCNFTNLNIDPAAYLSENPKFAISALKRYTQWDFIDFIAKNGIAYHEKTLGQLFCDGSAGQVVSLLRDKMHGAGVQLRLQNTVTDVAQTEAGFAVISNGQTITARSLVIATGGKSIPKMGATGFGYDIARQFNVALVDTRAGLVPLTFGGTDLVGLKELSGLSVPARVSCGAGRFEEGLLFTHRGLSGPSILQVSSYWREGDSLTVTLAPGQDVLTSLKGLRVDNGRQEVKSALAQLVPKRLAALILPQKYAAKNMGDMSDAALDDLAQALTNWRLTPTGSEGYRTAEVTLGGVSTAALDAKTMQVKSTPGLYFIGEVVDVTGWLGGYNFQWAWSSGWAAGQDV